MHVWPEIVLIARRNLEEKYVTDQQSADSCIYIHPGSAATIDGQSVIDFSHS